MEEIIVEKKENSILVCVLENNKIVEKYSFTNKSNSTIGNIYIGTVRDIFNGMQAAFVDIGLEKNAFLSLKDAVDKVNMVKECGQESDFVKAGSESKNCLKKSEVKLSKILKKGQNILVQVRKESFEDKGARISTHITLAGNYLVLMPETDIITTSQKITNQNEKERLVNIINANLPENYGCIIRTDAEGISDTEIIEDLKKVLELWKEIQIKSNTVCYKNCLQCEKKGGNILEIEERLIHNDNNITMKIARDMIKKTTKKVYVNNKEIYENLKLVTREELLEFKENNDFIAEFGLYDELEKSDNRKIWLKCGAQIVIDKTEALTAIDVNSSRCMGNEELEKTIFKVNKEAAVEIMKQLRLKDIGGIIIIDFIDMYKQEYKDEILKIMKEAQKKDRSKIEIKDFTQLNLVEMTRKKLYV